VREEDGRRGPRVEHQLEGHEAAGRNGRTDGETEGDVGGFGARGPG
jgi:hypothetical protein